MTSEQTERHKRFILFQYHDCYPAGGLGDITASFDTIDEAKEHARKDRKDFNQIVDRDTWQVVWSD